MFMSDVCKKEEIRKIAIQDLRNFGIKHRPKKPKQTQTEARTGKKVFKRPLHSLPTEMVTLLSGQQLIVPQIVHRLCTFILRNAETEGLFRKGGSKSRQNEIKLLLDAGCSLSDHHEIDVANVLKTFLRELPEPLIPYTFQDLFLRCMLLGNNKTEAVLLACLLLPTEHLNTLAYLMQFFYAITEYSFANKMDAYNIAVVIGPSVFPTEEKIVPDAQQRLLKTCELFKILVENAQSIGILTENILKRVVSVDTSGSASDEDSATKKKKKRRSGSLTRMLNGIKKMVGSKATDDSIATVITPDLLLTPRITKSAKKRRIESSSMSARKKRELLSALPDGALRTPIIPGRTPVSGNPNPKRKSPLASCKQVQTGGREKKKQWYSRAKAAKLTKNEGNLASVNSAISQSTKSLFERRWSAVSQASVFRKSKKRNSCHAELPSEPETQEQDFTAEPDYVKISRSEYEEIKNRVSAIERRISVELAGVEEDRSDQSIDPDTIKNVQYAYEKTLVEAEPLSPTTDHLARRLSKELKIRRSSEQKVCRSPSARKIGSLRRRSQEHEKQTAKLTRNQTWHIRPDKPCAATPPGLFSPERRASRAASFHGTPLKLGATASSSWVNGEDFFCRSGASEGSLETSRASLAKLRSQNAGMVMAKAKLFDGMSDSKAKRGKIGAQRGQRSVRSEKGARKSRSPNLKRQQRVEEKENVGVGGGLEKVGVGVLKECNRIESVRGTPVIKKPLNGRSPKRVCRTPRIAAADKVRTPMRVEPIQ